MLLLLGWYIVNNTAFSENEFGYLAIEMITDA